jgi:hypothetical protein
MIAGEPFYFSPTCCGEGKGSFFAFLTMVRSSFQASIPGTPADECQFWHPAIDTTKSNVVIADTRNGRSRFIKHSIVREGKEKWCRMARAAI